MTELQYALDLRERAYIVKRQMDNVITQYFVSAGVIINSLAQHLKREDGYVVVTFREDTHEPYVIDFFPYHVENAFYNADNLAEDLRHELSLPVLLLGEEPNNV